MGEFGAGMLATGNDLAVLFDRDAFSGQVERFDQLAQRQRSWEGTGFAVDDKFKHKSRLLDNREFQYHPEFYPEGHAYPKSRDQAYRTANFKHAGVV